MNLFGIFLGLTFTFLAVLEEECVANTIEIINNCPKSILVGTLDGNQRVQVENGGFKLDSKQRKTAAFPTNWNGIIWGRTGCTTSGKCETGNCDGRVQCAGKGPEHPMTLAEFNFILKPEAGNLEYYDVSLVNGFNLPVTITPRSGDFIPNGNGPYDCKVADCPGSFDRCPADLRHKNANGQVVGCSSACDKFSNTKDGDSYCCRGPNHGTPETCKSKDWPKNYPADYKKMCPKAYSYAYDDQKSTFTCKPKNPGASRYTVQFC